MHKSFTTPKGTVLPLLDLDGKAYLQVAHRLVWFREDHPDWRIETEFPLINGARALAKASIKDNQGNVMSTGHKVEEKNRWPDYAEKAETGAVGRALALIGYGTQFCAKDLDEGSRIVDAPVIPMVKYPKPKAIAPEPTVKSPDPMEAAMKRIAGSIPPDGSWISEVVDTDPEVKLNS